MKKQLFLILTFSLVTLPLIGMDANQTTLSSAASAATPANTAMTTSQEQRGSKHTLGSDQDGDQKRRRLESDDQEIRYASSSVAATTSNNIIVFTTADDQEVTVEKEIAELCTTIKDALNFNTQDQNILLVYTKSDFEKLLAILQICVNPALSETQKAQAIKTALHGYTTQALIITLSIADFLNVQENIFQIILECATERIFDINNLKYLANEYISTCLQNYNLQALLLKQASKQMPGLAHWIDQLWRKPKTFYGHTDSIHSVGWCSCGTLFATASDDFTIKIWKPDDIDAPKATIDCDKTGKRIIAWSPSGKFLAVTLDKFTATIFNADDTTTPIATLQGTTDIVAIAWSPSGKLFAIAFDDDTLKIWNTDDTTSPVVTITADPGCFEDLTIIAWSPCGKFLATDSGNATTKIWKTDGTCMATLEVYEDDVITGISWSPCGNFLATASYDGIAKIWKIDGTCIATLEGHEGCINYIAWSPYGTVLATSSIDHTVKIWRTDGTCIATLTHLSEIDSCPIACWSPCGNFLATGSRNTVKIFKTNGDFILEFIAHTGSIKTIAWSPCGNFLATGSSDKTAKVWNINCFILSAEQVFFLIYVYQSIQNKTPINKMDIPQQLLIAANNLPDEVFALMPDDIKDIIL